MRQSTAITRLRCSRAWRSSAADRTVRAATEPAIFTHQGGAKIPGFNASGCSGYDVRALGRRLDFRRSAWMSMRGSSSPQDRCFSTQAVDDHVEQLFKQLLALLVNVLSYEVRIVKASGRLQKEDNSPGDGALRELLFRHSLLDQARELAVRVSQMALIELFALLDGEVERFVQLRIDSTPSRAWRHRAS